MIEKLLQKYQNTGLKIVTVESCTGGLLASHINSIAGSSQIFDRGFITYSNQSKIDLGVPQNILEEYGAVSEQTAIAMAEAGLNKSGADVSIAITGIAGPTGGSKDKPVGLVWFGITTRNNKTFSTKETFTGNRNSIQNQAAKKALEMLINAI